MSELRAAHENVRRLSALMLLCSTCQLTMTIYELMDHVQFADGGREVQMRKKKAPVSLATARAMSVLPVPGGPYSNTPRGGLMPMDLKS